MKKAEQIGFQIKAIELLNLSLSSPLTSLSNTEVFQFEVSIEHKIRKENPLVFVICNVNIFDESKANLYGNIRTSCTYEVQGLSKSMKKGEQQFELPDELVSTLNSISISSLRGVMFSNFRGTFLQNAILPIIDPAHLKPEG